MSKGAYLFLQYAVPAGTRVAPWSIARVRCRRRHRCQGLLKKYNIIVKTLVARRRSRRRSSLRPGSAEPLRGHHCPSAASSPPARAPIEVWPSVSVVPDTYLASGASIEPWSTGLGSARECPAAANSDIHMSTRHMLFSDSDSAGSPAFAASGRGCGLQIEQNFQHLC